MNSTKPSKKNIWRYAAVCLPGLEEILRRLYRHEAELVRPCHPFVDEDALETARLLQVEVYRVFSTA